MLQHKPELKIVRDAQAVRACCYSAVVSCRNYHHEASFRKVVQDDVQRGVGAISWPSRPTAQ